MRITLHWIGVVITTLMCIASTVASLRFIIIDAKVSPTGLSLHPTLPSCEHVELLTP